MSRLFEHHLVRKHPSFPMPDDTQSLITMGWDFLREGRVTDSLQVCVKLSKVAPQSATAQFLMSKVALKVGDAEIALEHADKAIAVDDKAAFYLQKAQCELILNERSAAIASVAAATSGYSGDIAILQRAGSLLNQCEDIAGACKVYRRALELEPANPDTLFSLATCMRFLGELEEAEQLIGRVITKVPENHQATLFRSDLRRQTPDNNHIADLESRLAKGASDWKGEMNLCYALAKESEDVGNYARSFEVLQRGSAVRRRHLEYSVERDVAVLEDIQTHYHSEEQCQQDEGYDSKSPIFILGMPRTGTTLVEQIVASHSEVMSAGELNDFSTEMVQEIQRAARGRPINKQQIVRASLGCDFARLGANYVRSANQVVAATTPYFIDKLPFNFLYCGLIRRALPGAKIIHLQRDPMDTCYAIYKTLFGQAYPFSYDLDELATYYIAYRKLMAHWRRIMPGTILDIAYEDVVADTELQARRVIEYCELQWQPQCLEFHDTKTVSTTASAAQVRQPVYSSSVQKWRNYEAQLAPLQQRLKEADMLSL